jgi:putative ubiquitin-RnfH superfamily antitoxin RatB of RatAB toxin-antitoxin module
MGSAEVQPGAADGSIRVQVVYARQPHAIEQVDLELPQGSTLGDAVAASGVAQRLPAAEFEALQAGVWGRLKAPETLLREGDRIELYRPLKVDPKEARRQRYQRDGIKRARKRTP